MAKALRYSSIIIGLAVFFSLAGTSLGASYIDLGHIDEVTISSNKEYTSASTTTQSNEPSHTKQGVEKQSVWKYLLNFIHGLHF
jgi:hypothetical protein